VRADNPGAIEMYADLGFEERTRRSTWQARSGAPPQPAPSSPTITPRAARLWPQQLAWLEQLHPEELAWYRSWNWKRFKPGFWNWLYRAFVEFEQRQWAGFADGRLQGVLAWTPTGRTDRLWLACTPDSDPDTLTALLARARSEIGGRQKLTLEHPAETNGNAIQAAGFELSRTLVWMCARGATR